MQRALISDGGTTTAGQRAALPLPMSLINFPTPIDLIVDAVQRGRGDRGPLECAQTLLPTGTTQHTH